MDKNLSITNVCVYGLEESAIASGFPMLANYDSMAFFEATNNYGEKLKAYGRADRLSACKGGESHDCFLCGVIAQFNLTAPRYFCQEWQRYHFQDIISSTSTMHRIKTFINEVVERQNKIKSMGDAADIEYGEFLLEHFAEDTDVGLIELFVRNAFKKMAELPEIEALKYIKANLPEGFKFTARITTNYRQLKTMYHQRKNHRLEEWRHFCDELKRFPHSNWIIGEE